MPNISTGVYTGLSVQGFEDYARQVIDPPRPIEEPEVVKKIESSITSPQKKIIANLSLDRGKKQGALFIQCPSIEEWLQANAGDEIHPEPLGNFPSEISNSNQAYYRLSPCKVDAFDRLIRDPNLYGSKFITGKFFEDDLKDSNGKWNVSHLRIEGLTKGIEIKINQPFNQKIALQYIKLLKDVCRKAFFQSLRERLEKEIIET